MDGNRSREQNQSQKPYADGVVVIDPEYLKGRKLYGQIICSFRYGREEDEMMGLEFQKDLLMASGEITKNNRKESTRMQVRSSTVLKISRFGTYGYFQWQLAISNYCLQLLLLQPVILNKDINNQTFRPPTNRIEFNQLNFLK